ncbi:MAG: hypothetical protein WEE89_07055 [Gemmatimonadota bacterium]
MSNGHLDVSLLETALFDRRFTALARVGVDLAGIATWDRNLDRRTRLLVPIDVQALVVPTADGEATVPIAGAGADDPAPFADGVVRPAGVHLHWAMPDALLHGRHRPAAEDGSTEAAPDFPPLPDRWVVIRALLPNRVNAAIITGWVIDARAKSVTPLAEFSGTPAAGPAGAQLERLDAAFGGSLLWTASYTASDGRFTVHDPLTDIPATGSTAAPNGLDAAGAVYTVAGWWSNLADDPLAGSLGRQHLDARLAELGWHVNHDADDDVHESEDPRIARVRTGLGLTSPAETGVSSPLVGREMNKLEGVHLQVGVPVSSAETVIVGPSRPRYAAMLHGAILGVPITGALPAGIDERPASDALAVAIGTDIDDVVAALGAPALGAGEQHRASAERLTAAFTSDMLDRLGSADGLADLAEREHSDGFASFPGTPVPGARPDRLRGEDALPMGPNTVGRKGRGRTAVSAADKRGAVLRWRDGLDLVEGTAAKTRSAPTFSEVAGSTAPPGEPREVTRPAPRFFRPEAPVMAIRGAHPNHRHHGDGLYDDLGRLGCRYPRECVPAWEGVVSGEVVVPSIGSRAVPDEVLLVVREAVLVNPYGYRWLAAAGAASTGNRAAPLETRLAAEMVRLYGVDGRYDGTIHLSAPQPHAMASSWAEVSETESIARRQMTAEIARFSLLRGTPPSPVAITTWRQPWVPLWLEWDVTVEGDSTMIGWTLQGLDLERDKTAATAPALNFTFHGRSPIGQGVSIALQHGIRRWLEAEVQRDASGASITNEADQRALERLGDLIGPLDLVSASLNGISEQLLGHAYVGNSVEGPAGADGATLPLAEHVPVALFGGILRLNRLRLIDAFGRVLTVPATVAATTTTLEVPSVSAGMRLRPRFQHAGRWLWRLVDPALPATADPTTAREAFVDQLDPVLAVNPVVGFLLPDHIDEALEFFSVGSEPLGQLMHDAVSGAVVWETAPGRPLPPDAGPLAGLDAHTRIAGEIAAGLVQADLAARTENSTATGSALSALLRAIDTTLWTVDTFASVGSPTVAGLIGRPVAIVRATLRLEVPDDLAEVSTPDPELRRAAFEMLTEQRFPIQLGTLERSDDALLGFFVDDDYAHVHLVDKVVAAQALESGRHRGQLGLLGNVTAPALDPLVHPYVVEEDVLWVRPGQTLRLTMLMLPAGKVHLTSGILPRKSLALADDWVTPGLARVMPSVRVGPVLVDPSEIRLPLVALLGDKQTFTRRTGPLTWRNDPIVAATQTALLPRLPHEVQEGWIRVTPEAAEEAP